MRRCWQRTLAWRSEATATVMCRDGETEGGFQSVFDLSCPRYGFADTARARGITKVEEPVRVNGHQYNYAYRFTREYPYTLGCFTGDLLAGTEQVIRKEMGSRRQRPGSGTGRRGDGSRRLAAAARLGVSTDALRRALGPPPPDLAAAANTLGISEQALPAALRPARQH